MVEGGVKNPENLSTSFIDGPLGILRNFIPIVMLSLDTAFQQKTIVVSAFYNVKLNAYQVSRSVVYINCMYHLKCDCDCVALIRILL